MPDAAYYAKHLEDGNLLQIVTDGRRINISGLEHAIEEKFGSAEGIDATFYVLACKIFDLVAKSKTSRVEAETRFIDILKARMAVLLRTGKLGEFLNARGFKRRVGDGDVLRMRQSESNLHSLRLSLR